MSLLHITQFLFHVISTIGSILKEFTMACSLVGLIISMDRTVLHLVIAKSGLDSQSSLVTQLRSAGRIMLCNGSMHLNYKHGTCHPHGLNSDFCFLWFFRAQTHVEFANWNKLSVCTLWKLSFMKWKSVPWEMKICNSWNEICALRNNGERQPCCLESCSSKHGQQWTLSNWKISIQWKTKSVSFGFSEHQPVWNLQNETK